MCQSATKVRAAAGFTMAMTLIFANPYRIWRIGRSECRLAALMAVGSTMLTVPVDFSVL